MSCLEEGDDTLNAQRADPALHDEVAAEHVGAVAFFDFGNPKLPAELLHSVVGGAKRRGAKSAARGEGRGMREEERFVE